ncbi:hypothetical protein UPYG_G00329900 [Umbra pygmaea]|uniref:Uncharacterized protein n=1 Tax=Umbra pygmaea TaxID=75934 RepID=A0ABD0W6I8_UMBPY
MGQVHQCSRNLNCVLSNSTLLCFINGVVCDGVRVRACVCGQRRGGREAVAIQGTTASHLTTLGVNLFVESHSQVNYSVTDQLLPIVVAQHSDIRRSC